jgi:hypothetical protein
LEDGRFSGLAGELRESLERYGAAKEAGRGEEELRGLREEARQLFEDHCVRSGLRSPEASYINIDAEFFEGNLLDGRAADTFIKNILKGHGYQRILWTYMGTYGSFTEITKMEMAEQGQQYADYLPAAYRQQNPPKKPLEGQIGPNEVLVYMYSDGSVSGEYNAEKARFRLDALGDRSGVNWKAGYDPNGGIERTGWHGTFNEAGEWVRVEDSGDAARNKPGEGDFGLELLRDGERVILHDPGRILLSGSFIEYLTEWGEVYGKQETDREAVLEDIRAGLAEMGGTEIGAVSCGAAVEMKGRLEAYREVLGELGASGLEMLDIQAVRTLKEKRLAEVNAVRAEESGVLLERKIRAIRSCGGRGVLEAMADGKAAAPVRTGDPVGREVLGLSVEDMEVLREVKPPEGRETEYDAVLSNIYAAWEEYESGGLSKGAAAGLIAEAMAGGGGDSVLNTGTSLRRILGGGWEQTTGDCHLYASGIPGVFGEPEAADFYNPAERERYIHGLEKRRILPKGMGEAAREAAGKLPPADLEEREAISRAVSRGLREYRTIARSTGMPVGEVIAAAAALGAGKEHPAMERKVYYELPVKGLIREGGKENRQYREIPVEELVGERREPEIIVGGNRGIGLDEALGEEQLKIYGLNGTEEFLHRVRCMEEGPALGRVMAALEESGVRGAEEVRRQVFTVLEGEDGVSYNLADEEGLNAYRKSGRCRGSGLRGADLEELRKAAAAVPLTAYGGDVAIRPRYRGVNAGAPVRRERPRGAPEKIAAVRRLGFERAGEREAAAAGPAAGEKTVRELSGLSAARLAGEYGYGEEEAAAGEELLEGLSVPAEKEEAYTRELSAQIEEAARQSRSGAALGNHLGELLRGRTNIVHHRNSAPGGIAGAVEWPFMAPGGGYYLPAWHAAPSGNHVAVNGGGGSAPVIAEAPIAFERPPYVRHGNITDGSFGTRPEIVETADEAPETGKPAPAPVKAETAENGNRERDGERERLRRIEKNYEQDKAMLAKEKVPALARSDSHEVGHAGGSGETANLQKIAKLQRKDIAKELRRREGV